MSINKEKKPIDFEACERIEAVYKYLKEKTRINQGIFAKRIGITGGHISDVLGKKKNPGCEMISGILFAFSEISAEWLMRGNGAMLIQDSIQSEHKTKPPYTEIQKLNNVIQQLNIKLKEAETMRDAYRDEIMHYRQINLNVSGKGGPVPESKRSAGGLENDRKAM